MSVIEWKVPNLLSYVLADKLNSNGYGTMEVPSKDSKSTTTTIRLYDYAAGKPLQSMEAPDKLYFAAYATGLQDAYTSLCGLVQDYVGEMTNGLADMLSEKVKGGQKRG